MSSAIRRKSRDRSLKNDKSANSKLRMDSKAPTPRITDPSLPAGRRREIDNVMKKARARVVSPTQNAYWDKKLLEVEAKDPNRWRHSGFKSLYVDGSSSPSPGRRSRSRSQRRATPPGRRSPPTGRRSPATGRRSPQSRPAASGRRSPVPGRRSPRSPPSRRSPVRARSPGSRRSPLAYRTSSPQRRSPATAPRACPRSPPPKSAPRRSASRSSISSCSDDSCSVCSPKNPRTKRSSRSRSFSVPRSRDKHAASKAAHEKASKVPNRPRPPSPKSPAPRRMPRPMTPPTASGPSKMRPRLPPSDRPTDPRRQPPPPRPRVGRTGKVIDVSGVKPPPKTGKKPKEPGAQPMMLKRIKKEKTKKRPGSPGGESSSSDESTSSMNHIVATTGITLSERFGKIAQWSADRERREIENMRITKTGADLKVMIEEDDLLYGSPSRRTSPLPGGHVPDDIMSSGNSKRLAAWDDVRVRYQYYKELGYLRDLTLDDYIKWEEWWYKYQDWLANERHYERWVNNQSHRRRRKRIPASQRLN